MIILIMMIIAAEGAGWRGGREGEARLQRPISRRRALLMKKGNNGYIRKYARLLPPVVYFDFPSFMSYNGWFYLVTYYSPIRCLKPLYYLLLFQQINWKRFLCEPYIETTSTVLKVIHDTDAYSDVFCT